MLDISLSDSGAAPFEQVRAQIVELVSSGALAAGASLPTVRALASQLNLAPGTVAKAYRLLETDGFIETRGRNGSFVRAQGDAAAQAAQLAARAYVDRVRSLGATDAAALDWVRRALD